MFIVEKRKPVRHGDKLPHIVPGSHCGLGELQAIVKGLAMQKHHMLIERLTESCRMVTDRNNVLSLPDPATLKSDGFSSGVKSMEPHVLKIFLLSTSWNCSHEIFLQLPSYVSFEYNGDEVERRKTEAGLYTTIKYGLKLKFSLIVAYQPYV